VVILDKLLFVFHSSLIIFVLIGWAWPRIRSIHLIVLLLIAFSWFGLGVCYGIGYCPFTDWHWQVRESLGETDLPLSYIKFLLDKALGSDLDRGLVDRLTVILFFVAFLISVLLSWRDFRRSRCR
jgi:hypothetical protein